MKSNVKRYIQIIIAILIIAFLLYKIDLAGVWEVLKTINVYWLLVAFIVNLTAMLFMALSLNILFLSTKKIKFFRWLRYFLMSFSLGLVLPGKTGQASIIYFVRKEGVDVGPATALTIIDKLITVIIFGIFSFIGFFYIMDLSEAYVYYVAIFAIILFVVVLFSSPGRKIIRALMGKYAKYFTGFHKTYKRLVRYHKEKIFVNITITVMKFFFNGLVILLIFKSLGADSTLMFCSFVAAITFIASLVPITPNGLGVREGLGIFLFDSIGIVPEVSLSMYLILLLFTYGKGIVGAILFYQRKKEPKYYHNPKT